MSGAEARCFGCGLAFSHDALRPVGDASFCAACFAGLLARGTQAQAKPAGTAGLTAPPRVHTRPATPSEGGPALCFLCSEPAGADVFVRLRGFVICKSCSEDLLVEPAEGEAEAVPEPAAPAKETAPSFTPGAGTATCAGCGRPMPGPGSYRLIPDLTGTARPHCAACAPAAEARAQAAPPRACDCCQRAGELRPTNGFQLCAACLESDPALSVAIARKRHHRELDRLARTLGDDETSEN